MDVNDGTVGVGGGQMVFSTIRIDDCGGRNRPIVVVAWAHGREAFLVRIVVATAVDTPRSRAPTEFDGDVVVIRCG